MNRDQCMQLFKMKLLNNPSCRVVVFLRIHRKVFNDATSIESKWTNVLKRRLSLLQ